MSPARRRRPAAARRRPHRRRSPTACRRSRRRRPIGRASSARARADPERSRLGTYRGVMVRRAAAAMLVGIGLVATGCRPDTVRLAYRPRAGDHTRYRVVVRTITKRTLPGLPDDVADDTARLTARQTVLAVTGGVARVRVVLSRPGGPDRTLVVRFDRSGALLAVDSIEGLPASALGRLGLPEVFPGAGVAPGTPLRPGQRWHARRSRGRLVELGLEHHRHVARVTSHTELPASARAPTADGG